MFSMSPILPLLNRDNLSAPLPQPGEIWQIKQSVLSPLDFSEVEWRSLYSETAQQFLKGNLPRYVMIVREPELVLETANDSEWQAIAVMVLSGETRFLSEVDCLIPAQWSGLGQDLIAETWQVVLMLAANLNRPVGARLSRQIYDQLLDSGEDCQSFLSPEVQAFHDREIAWSDVLTVPVSVCRTYFKAQVLIQALMHEALALEPVPLALSEPICLSQWLQGIFVDRWQALEPFWTPTPPLAMGLRSKPEIESADTNEIMALVHQLETATDDEVLWAAVERLRLLDPTNQAIGVRRIRHVDWGMQLAKSAISLVVSFIPRAPQQVYALLQVYPMNQANYLLEGLKLVLLDVQGQPLRELMARSQDFCIQLKFRGTVGESFAVRVELGDAKITEDFRL
jgi:hypothetical protein